MIKKLLFSLVISIALIAEFSLTALALSQEQKNLYNQNILYYDINTCVSPDAEAGPNNPPDATVTVCECSSSLSTTGTTGTPGTITEYPGAVDPSLVAELKEIKKTIEPNLSAYQAAASRWGVPWQALAATHWREGTAGATKSMVNGTSLPTQSELGGRQYIWGSADARIDVRSFNKADIPIGNGGAPARRFYGTLQQDIDYATWLLIEHGTRRQFNGNPDTFIQKVQGPGLTKEEWTNTWSAYLGGASLGYGSFGKDSQGRMGAGAIMAFLGGLDEKPPAPTVQYPGKSDSDYEKVAGGVSGAITAGQSGSNCGSSSQPGAGGIVDASGYAFPIAARTKSDYNTFGGLSAVPCNNSGGCHHNENHPNAGYAFDLGVNGYGPDRSENAPVYAISDGTLTFVNNNNRRPSGYSTCNSITLTSSKDGFVYWYGHLAQDFSIRTGMKVVAGQGIGKVGNTRCADVTAPHLHISRVPSGASADTESRRDAGLIDIINNTFNGLPN